MDFTFGGRDRKAYPQKHILVCEDNLRWQQQIMAKLARMYPPDGNVQITLVSGGLAASAVVTSCRVDLILLDGDMPQGSGAEFLRWMAGRTKIPVITFADKYPEIAEMASLGAHHPFFKQQVLDNLADQFIDFYVPFRQKHPKVSVLLSSGRPGGIDMALRGLADQTYDDFEVVFVDGLYHKRHAKVLDEVARVGLKKPFFHVPHHRSPDNDIWGVPCAGYNTGFMLADGEIVIMLLDYAYAPPGWIEAHLKAHIGKPRLVMGPNEYRQMPDSVAVSGIATPGVDGIHKLIARRALFDDISIFQMPFDPMKLGDYPPLPPQQNDTKLSVVTGPASWHLMHTKNDSFARETVLDINGMDEFYDRGRGPGDTDLGRRLHQAGLEPWLASDAKVTCFNPRSILPNANTFIPDDQRLPIPFERRFTNDEGKAHYEHVAALGNPVANNPYLLRTRREQIWNWRDLSQMRETVIPDNRISDREWFRDL